MLLRWRLSLQLFVGLVELLQRRRLIITKQQVRQFVNGREWLLLLRLRSLSGAHRRRNKCSWQCRGQVISSELALDEVHCDSKALAGKPTVIIQVGKIPVDGTLNTSSMT